MAAGAGKGASGLAARRAATGRRGEALAARHLEDLGYRIVARNFRCPYGELDLIATTEEYLVFVEVKTRSARTAYHPSISVTPRKVAKLRQLGLYYLGAHPAPRLQPRFDVISVVLGGAGPEVEHIVNAF
jgi:putative endonuclease